MSTSGVTLSDFSTLCVLGKGSYAQVYLVKKNDTNEIFAMKILSKQTIADKHQEKHVRTEREVLTLLNHKPFFIDFHYSFEMNKNIYFILEYCPGGELFTLIQKNNRLTESQARFFGAQLVLAIETLHSKDIIYRDLKPENVLLDIDGYIKITDFGLSRQNVTNKDALSICGTLEYLAPEVIDNLPYGKAVDWWTLGCFICEMITGSPPFCSKDKVKLFEDIKRNVPKLPPNLSSQGISLLSGLMCKNQDKRLGVNGATEVKSHPWFQGIEWKYLISKKYQSPFKVKINSTLGLENFNKKYTASNPLITDTAMQNDMKRKFSNFQFDENVKDEPENVKGVPNKNNNYYNDFDMDLDD